MVITATLLLSGCNSSSSILVGTARPAIQPSTVKVFDTPPKSFEVIALIEATGKTGWSAQKKTDGAIASLKEQAAAIGANGVLIEKFSDETGTYQGTSYINKKVQGRAILVKD